MSRRPGQRPSLAIGIVWRGSIVPVSMRSLGADRSLGKFPPAGRLESGPIIRRRRYSKSCQEFDRETRVRLGIVPNWAVLGLFNLKVSQVYTEI